MMDRTVYEVFGSDAKTMTMALLEAAEVNERIPAGASIALKPNLVVPKSPDSGATTHAGVLEGILEYLTEHGRRNMAVIEGAWVGDSTRRGFAVCGYDALAKRFHAELIDLKQDKTRTVQTKIGPMEICCKALDTDYLINLPVLKGHCQTVMTCSLKNCKGCIPDKEKRRFHALGLHRPIAALAAALKPQLTIVDAICGDLDFEEGGTPVPMNRMLLGTDMVMLDAYGCRLMGIRPSDVSYIALAESFGAGHAAMAENELVQLNTPDCAQGAFSPVGIVKKLTKNVDARQACSACFGNLVHALYRMEREGTPCREPIAIGQGFSDVPVDGVGVGRCVNCAANCIAGCPPTADAIMAALRAQ